MSIRTRLVLALAAAFPAVAHAQEPQPWTNTSTYGSRVSPALEVDPEHAWAMRAEGGSGSTSKFNLTDRADPDVPGAETSASFVSGRAGGSWGFESWEVFGTTNAYQVTIPKLKNELAPNPFTQSGDAAIGGRWTKALGSGMNAGAETGAVFLGTPGEPGETGVVFAGPAFGATSPFVRGLFTWQGMPRPKEERGALTASANFGVFMDQSWKVWELAAADADDGVEEDPLEEERTALGFYGKDGPATRMLFGANVCYDVHPMVRPYVELTGESTDADLTMRLTPGVSLRPTKAISIFLSADLDMSGDPQASPRAPALRANAGLQLAFGPRVARPGVQRTSRPTPTPKTASTPIKKGTTFVGVRVTDEKGKGIVGARVRIYRAVRNPQNELMPTADEKPLGEGVTSGEQATVNVSVPEAVRNTERLLIMADHDQHMEWLPVEIGPRQSLAGPIVLYRERTTVNFSLQSCSPGWVAPPGSSVIVAPQPHGAVVKGRRTFAYPTEVIQIPADPAFQKVRFTLDFPGFEKSPPAEVDDLARNATYRLFVDAEKRCADLNGRCACAAAPTPTPTPSVQREEIAYLIFTGDGVEVDKVEAKRLSTKLETLRGVKHRVIVQAKKGDPIFQSALAGARRDALLNWLTNEGNLPPGSVFIEMNPEGKTDHVLLEVLR